jgi:diguanylate cyclase (GGDEF)-like protein
MATPLLAGRRLVGVIAVVDANPERKFTPSDLRLLNLFAQQAALALERARMFGVEKRGREAAVALLEITQVAGSSLEPKQVLKHIAQRTASACRVNRCTIFLLDDAGEFLLPVMSQFADGHTDREQWETFKRTAADRIDVVPLFRDVIRERRPTLLDDALHTDLIPLKWTQPFGIRKLLVVPLISHDQAIGLMAIDHSDASREFTPDQINLTMTIGGQAASAISNARLFAESQRRAAEMNVLQQTALDLVSHLETQPLLETIVRRATDLLGGAGGLIYQWEEATQQLRCTISYGLSRDYTNVTLKPGEGMAGRVYQTGKPLIVNDYPHWEGRAAHLRDIPSRAVISVPIPWHDRVIGVLNVNDESGARAFDDHDIQLLTLFANQAAIAMENARLFEETQRLAITDNLTGLHNRRRFFELAEREFQRARRFGRTVGAMMLDIDHFKQVNDTCGHAAGDEVLRAVAERCRKNLRDIDLCGRYGGEEFVVLLPETDLSGTRNVAERLRRCIADVPIETSAGLVPVTISLGIAVSTDDCPDVAALINQADAGMYAAKAAGRNRVGEAKD